MKTYCRACVQNDESKAAYEAVRKEAIEYAEANNIDLIIILQDDKEFLFVLDGDSRAQTMKKIDTIIF